MLKTNDGRGRSNQASHYRKASLTPAAIKLIGNENINDSYLVRKMSYMHSNLVDVVKLINKCYSIQVSSLL